MSQYDFGTIVATTKSGTALAADLNAWRSAVHSMHKGPTAPTYAVAGMQWCDDTTSPIWIVKQYDGVAWSSLAVVDSTNDKMWAVGQDLRYRYPLAGGTANALLLAPVPAPTTYTINDVYTFEAGSNITGPATLNVSTLGVKTIRKISVGVDVDLEVGDIVDGGRYIVSYDPAANAAAGAFMLANPSIASMPVGSILSYAGRVAPAGWLFCAGQSVSRTTYSRLFNVIAPLIGTCTITIASPAVITLSAHGFVPGDRVSFETTGLLPTGLAVGTTYFVMTAGLTANTFQVAATYSPGIAINTSGTQSGVHSARFSPYGAGNGTTTFVVPNYQGRVGAGRDNMSGTSQNRLTYAGSLLDGDVLGMAGGFETHTLLDAQMPSHNHTFTGTNQYWETGTASANHSHNVPGNMPSGTGAVNTAGYNTAGFGPMANNELTSESGYNHFHGIYVTPAGTVGVAGSDAAHPIVQPTIIENVIIKF